MEARHVDSTLRTSVASRPSTLTMTMTCDAVTALPSAAIAPVDCAALHPLEGRAAPAVKGSPGRAAAAAALA